MFQYLPMFYQRMSKWGQQTFMLTRFMPRVERINIEKHVCHVLNRANARAKIFDDDKDYQLFENTLR